MARRGRMLGYGVETGGGASQAQRSKLAVAISQHDASNPVLFGSVQKRSGMKLVLGPSARTGPSSQKPPARAGPRESHFLSHCSAVKA